LFLFIFIILHSAISIHDKGFKSSSQQDIQAVHRIRFQLIKWRTALANKVRGLLGEYGIVVAQGLAPLRRELPLILDDEENHLSGLFR
jgi:transposase